MNAKIFLAAAAALAAAAPLSAAAAGGHAFTDAEIVGLVGAANQGELDAAGLASGKARDAVVKKFAEHMTKDHGDAKQKLDAVDMKAGIAPEDTEASRDMTRHASEEAGQLGDLSGADFDRAYIDAQIADHATLLKSLDEDLIPNAKDASLAALLRQIRPVVSHHLAMARRIQGELARGAR